MNTSMIMCVATYGDIPGVWACTIRGEHGIACPGDTCTGCLTRPAQRGFLCTSHYDQADRALQAWDEWSRGIVQVGDRAMTPDRDGATGGPAGFVPLTGWQLAYDECARHLADAQGQPLQLWASTEEGAIHALKFAVAAERAYRAHQVRERPHRIERKRCPECGTQLLWLPPVAFAGDVTVTCLNDDCGHQITLDELEQLDEYDTRKDA